MPGRCCFRDWLALGLAVSLMVSPRLLAPRYASRYRLTVQAQALRTRGKEKHPEGHDLAGGLLPHTAMLLLHTATLHCVLLLHTERCRPGLASVRSYHTLVCPYHIPRPLDLCSYRTSACSYRMLGYTPTLWWCCRRGSHSVSGLVPGHPLHAGCWPLQQAVHLARQARVCTSEHAYMPLLAPSQAGSSTRHAV